MVAAPRTFRTQTRRTLNRTSNSGPSAPRTCVAPNRLLLTQLGIAALNRGRKPLIQKDEDDAQVSTPTVARSVRSWRVTRDMSRRETIRNGVRVAITGFVALLLLIVTLGWIWTAQHQAPALSLASHVVLTIAALAGIFAVAKIWRDDAPGERR